MKVCYPVILEKCEDGSGYLVTFPILIIILSEKPFPKLSKWQEML